MRNSQARFERKNIRLPDEYYIGRRWYFVTACCQDRRPVFSDPTRARWLLEQLREIAALQAFSIHAYCVMPDHVHLLAEGIEESSHLLKFIDRFKQQTGWEYSQHTDGRLWQKKFYDHILRGKDRPEAVAWYIWSNPMRKGFCSTPEDYAYSGSFTNLWRVGGEGTQPWIPPWKMDAPGLGRDARLKPASTKAM